MRSCHNLKFLSGEIREVPELHSQEVQSVAATLLLGVRWGTRCHEEEGLTEN
jgi:hypothetical protein